MPLTAIELSQLKTRLKREEGLRTHPYRDSRGFLSIGYGTNLDAGLSQDACEYLLMLKLNDVINDLEKTLPIFNKLDSARKIVIADMAYNLGMVKLFEFRKMFNALENNNFHTAVKEMLDSAWASQVGQRAHDLAYIMETGFL